jgi:hypothetical protein
MDMTFDEKYSSGLCCEFAWALSEIIHKPVYCYFVHGFVGHAFVKISEETAQDAEGIKTISAMKNKIMAFAGEECELKEVKNIKEFEISGGTFWHEEYERIKKMLKNKE